jgi:hypothetical protein
MNTGFVAIIDAQRIIQAQLDYKEPGEERPSRIRRAVAALGQSFGSIVKRSSATPERREVAQDSLSIGD